MTTPDADGRPHAFAGHLVSARRRARQRLLAHLMTARQDERRRIARDLSEHPLRSMTALRARLEELGPRLEEPGMGRELESLRHDIEEVCRTLQRLVADLE